MDEEEYIEIQDLNEATTVAENDQIIIHQVDGQDRRVKLANVKAGAASEADHAASATEAESADEATHAASADEATHAASADTATNATNATNADEATHATSADSSTTAGKATNDSDGNSIKDTYAKKAGDTFTGNVSITGNLEVTGNLTQKGESYETHAEKVFTKNDEIITRDGAVSGLASGEYSGIRAKKYDGTNDGLLVFDNAGEARVGDEGDTEPLLTRDESTNMIDAEGVIWDAANKRVKAGSGTELSATALTDASFNGTKLGTNDIRAMLEVANYWLYLGFSPAVKTFSCYDSITGKNGILVRYSIGTIMAVVYEVDGTILKLGYEDTDWTKVGSDSGGSGASPIGSVLAYSGATAPAGFLLCDGTEYNQADYPDLYNIVKNLAVCKSSTTGKFKVPDLRNKFVEGAYSNLGASIAAGLPNITGTWQYDTNCNTVESTATLTGAFSKGSQTSNNKITFSNTGNVYAGYYELQFDASKSNSIYGNSNTVQPPAVALNYIIKATQTRDDLDTTIDDSKTDVGHAWSGSKINDCICNSGKTYIVTPVNTSTSSTLTIPDNIPLVAGNIIRIFVNGNCKATSTSTTVSNFDLYLAANNFTNKNIFVYRNGQKEAIAAKKISNYAMYIQKGIVLEIIWDGENWVVLGNPVVLSNDAAGSPTNRYKYYADGSSAFISIDFANVVKKFTVSQTEQSWTATCDCFLNASIGGFNGTYGYVKINDVAVLNQTTGSAALINYESLSVFVKKGDVVKYKEGYTTNLSSTYGQPYCVCYALSYR